MHLCVHVSSLMFAQWKICTFFCNLLYIYTRLYAYVGKSDKPCELPSLQRSSAQERPLADFTQVLTLVPMMDGSLTPFTRLMRPQGLTSRQKKDLMTMHPAVAGTSN